MFFLPLFDENSTSNRPVIVWLVMAVCIMVFFWQQSLDDVSARLALYQLGFVPTIVFQGDTLPTKLILVPAWTTISHQCFCMGAGYTSVVICFICGFLATMSKMQWGGLNLLCSTFLCGIIAALAQAAINPSSSIPMVGASGGIAGVLGAYLILHPKAAVRCLMVIIVFFVLSIYRHG